MKQQRHSMRIPISALNLKNPGPITSLLQSYKESTTYSERETRQTSKVWMENNQIIEAK